MKLPRSVLEIASCQDAALQSRTPISSWCRPLLKQAPMAHLLTSCIEVEFLKESASLLAATEALALQPQIFAKTTIPTVTAWNLQTSSSSFFNKDLTYCLPNPKVLNITVPSTKIGERKKYLIIFIIHRYHSFYIHNSNDLT